MEQLALRRAEQTAEAASAARLLATLGEAGTGHGDAAAGVLAAWCRTAEEQAATVAELRRVRSEYDLAKWKGRWTQPTAGR